MLATKNTMTAAAISAAIFTGGLATAPAVMAGVSANIGVVSNYVWRGATQTQNAPAIQGGIDYESDFGFYVGTWVSNVDFEDTVNLEDADGGGVVAIRSGSQYELDGYFGWGMNFTDNVGLDLNYIYYHYGQLEAGSDFGEFLAAVNFWWFEVGAGYTTNGQADSSTAPFVEGDYAYWGKFYIPFAESWGLGLTVGEYKFTNDGVVTADGVNDYDYVWGQLDINHSLDEYGDITMSVTKADQQADGNDSPKVFITWTKGF